MLIMISWTKLLIYGMLLGVANIVPGVSGGTTAVILNIYNPLIDSVANLKSKPKQSIRFLFPLLVGCGLGILFFANIIKLALANYPAITNFFFIGLIVGSFPLLYKKAYNKGSSKILKPTISLLIGVIIMIALATIVPSSEGVVYETLTISIFLKLFFVSMLAASAMILPGISGSFIMLLFGTYTTILSAISSFNIIILIPAGSGILIGIFGGAKIINILLIKSPNITYGLICGLVIGSVYSIYPGLTFDISGALSVLSLLVGAIITLWFSSDKRSRITRKKGNINV